MKNIEFNSSVIDMLKTKPTYKAYREHVKDCIGQVELKGDLVFKYRNHNFHRTILELIWKIEKEEQALASESESEV